LHVTLIAIANKKDNSSFWRIKMNNWWSSLPLKNKLQIPIQLTLFVIIVIAQLVVLAKFDERVLEESRQKAVVSMDGVLNGLNMLMINGIISNADQRALFVKKMGASEKVLELRVIRGKSMQDQFGPGLPSEQPGDEMDRNTLESAKEQSKLLDQNGVQSLRVVVPFIAKKDFRGTNCLQCHQVTEGTVIGAVSITLDVSDEFSVVRHANWVLWGAQAFMQIFLFFAIGWLISFAIRPLQQAVKMAGAVARGDLTQRIEVKASDEMGQLLQALQDMNESLVGIVGDVRSTSDSIGTAAQQIAAGNRDLS
jgi:methyl-accepting chemotaxis protein